MNCWGHILKIYKYQTYEDYVDSQKKANRKKASRVWAREKYIRRIAGMLTLHSPKKGICHGVRTGAEVDWFTKYLPDCDVAGTDIGYSQNPKVACWDFNKGNINWHKRLDFVYSNSFDHAYDPHTTVALWVSQLKPGGILVLEYDKRQQHRKGPNAMDPVSMSIEEMAALLKEITGKQPELTTISDKGEKRWRGVLTVRV